MTTKNRQVVSNDASKYGFRKLQLLLKIYDFDQFVSFYPQKDSASFRSRQMKSLGNSV